MPSYQYFCQNCQSKFNLNLSLKERENPDDQQVCPHCQSNQIKAQFNLLNFLSNVFYKEKKCCCQKNSQCNSSS